MADNNLLYPAGGISRPIQADVSTVTAAMGKQAQAIQATGVSGAKSLLETIGGVVKTGLQGAGDYLGELVREETTAATQGVTIQKGSDYRAAGEVLGVLKNEPPTVFSGPPPESLVQAPVVKAVEQAVMLQHERAEQQGRDPMVVAQDINAIVKKYTALYPGMGTEFRRIAASAAGDVVHGDAAVYGLLHEKAVEKKQSEAHAALESKLLQHGLAMQGGFVVQDANGSLTFRDRGSKEAVMAAFGAHEAHGMAVKAATDAAAVMGADNTVKEPVLNQLAVTRTSAARVAIANTMRSVATALGNIPDATSTKGVTQASTIVEQGQAASREAIENYIREMDDYATKYPGREGYWEAKKKSGVAEMERTAAAGNSVPAIKLMQMLSETTAAERAVLGNTMALMNPVTLVDPRSPLHNTMVAMIQASVVEGIDLNKTYGNDPTMKAKKDAFVAKHGGDTRVLDLFRLSRDIGEDSQDMVQTRKWVEEVHMIGQPTVLRSYNELKEIVDAGHNPYASAALYAASKQVMPDGPATPAQVANAVTATAIFADKTANTVTAAQVFGVNGKPPTLIGGVQDMMAKYTKLINNSTTTEADKAEARDNTAMALYNLMSKGKDNSQFNVEAQWEPVLKNLPAARFKWNNGVLVFDKGALPTNSNTTTIKKVEDLVKVTNTLLAAMGTVLPEMHTDASKNIATMLKMKPPKTPTQPASGSTGAPPEETREPSAAPGNPALDKYLRSKTLVGGKK